LPKVRENTKKKLSWFPVFGKKLETEILKILRNRI
jgi:hypothetical protein